MLDKFNYKIFESRIPGNITIMPKNSVLCKTVPEISKSQFLLDGGHFAYIASKSQVASIKILK